MSFNVVKYERATGIGQPAINQQTHSEDHMTRDDARRDAERAAEQHHHHGYNGEHDYFWGRDRDSNVTRIYSIQPDPVGQIIASTVSS